MGQTLSSPATAKTSDSGANDRYLYGVSEMQGWRISMEDAHAIILDLDENPDDTNTFFAVYDGHGGSTVAKFAGKHVHKRLLSEEAYREKRFDEALKRAFLGTDEDLLADPATTRDPSGCTAVAALITSDGKIYVANAGDSRSVISIKGEVKPLSFDHKPANEIEKARITGAGGYIESGRVNGNLALSRALGDFEFKKNYSLIPQKQIITADPDVTMHEITDEDEFLVLACDGIWDCLSSQQVVDFIRLKVSEGKELTEIGEMMCDHCLAPDTTSGPGIGCDNMTVLIIAILHGRTKEEWYQWVTDRVKSGYGYRTPSTIPQIYSPSRIAAFKARGEAMEGRERLRQERGDPPVGLITAGLARVLSGGGISFHPNIMGDGGRLMFGTDDSEDDEGIEDVESEGIGAGRSFFSDHFGLGVSSDSTKSLRERLDAFERDDDSDEDGLKDEDGDMKMSDMDEEEHQGTMEFMDGEMSQSLDGLQGEAPPPPKINGDTTPVQQHHSLPLGDALDPAVKADGLMDSSEDPLRRW